MRKQETIIVDVDLLDHIANAIQVAFDGMEDDMIDQDELRRLDMLKDNLYELGLKHELIARATVLFENSAFKVLEHPENGDEGSVMVLDKKTGWFAPESPFFDCFDIDEIFNWMCAEQR